MNVEICVPNNKQIFVDYVDILGLGWVWLWVAISYFWIII